MSEIRNTYYLYRHIRPDTDVPFYIGISSISNENAAKNHIRYRRAYRKDGRNDWWHRIVNKNKGKYSVEIMLENLTHREVLEKEQEFIELYGDMLCNLTSGGEGGYILSDEIIKKRKLTRPKHHKGISIDQYSTEGVFIKTWKSSGEAAVALNINPYNIRNVCKGFKKSAGGYVWRNRGESFNYDSVQKGTQITADGLKFKSVLEAVREGYGVESSIHRALKSGKLYRGLKWTRNGN